MDSHFSLDFGEPGIFTPGGVAHINPDQNRGAELDTFVDPLAIGGLGAGIVATTDVYDPFTNTWSVTASLPTPRFRLAEAVLNGTIYTIGGDSIVSTGGRTNAVETYGPTTVYTFSKN